MFKKIIKQPIIQPTRSEIVPNIAPKTEDFFVDDDEFDSFKRREPTTTMNIGEPRDDDHDDLIMISDDDEAKILKLLIKTDIEIKNKNSLKWKQIKKENHTKNQYQNKTYKMLLIRLLVTYKLLIIIMTPQ